MLLLALAECAAIGLQEVPMSEGELYLLAFFAALGLLCVVAGVALGFALWLIVRAARRRRAFRLTRGRQYD